MEKPQISGHLVEENPVSVEIMVQSAPFAAAVLQGLSQKQRDSQPHRPPHRLRFPCKITDFRLIAASFKIGCGKKESFFLFIYSERGAWRGFHGA